MKKKQLPVWALWSLLVSATLGLCALVWFCSPYWVQTIAYNAFRGRPLEWILSGAMVLLAVLAIVAFARSNERRGYDYLDRQQNRKDSSRYFRRGMTCAVLCVVAFGAIVFTSFYGEYAAARKVAQESAHAVEQAHPDYKERAALDHVANLRDSDKGDLRGDATDPRRIAGEDSWNTLLKDTKSLNRGGYTGLTIRTDGAEKPTRCAIPSDTSRRLDGWFSSNLKRAIADVRPGMLIDDADAYGLCADGKVTIVVPLKKYQGFFPVTQVPAGVALYDPAKDKVEVLDEVDPGKIPGPVYPSSIAKYQGEALKAFGEKPSFWSYHNSRMGYIVSNEDGDPNGSNPSEIQLSKTDGGASYVTPYSVRSKSGSPQVAAIGDVASDSVKTGTYNKYTLHTYSTDERRDTNAVVAEQIRNTFSDLEWKNIGLEIFEIVPTKHGEWVATLGHKRIVSYRVRITADNSCLESPDGTVLRCSDDKVPAGDDVTAPDAEPVTGPLSKLSDAEIIAQLQRLTKAQSDLLAEQARRVDSTQ